MDRKRGKRQVGEDRGVREHGEQNSSNNNYNNNSSKFTAATTAPTGFTMQMSPEYLPW